MNEGISSCDTGANRCEKDRSQSIATFPLKLHVTVSIGTAVQASSPAVSAASSRSRFSDGSLEATMPAIRTAQFHLDSLAKPQCSWKAALSLALASKLAYEPERDVHSTCLGSNGAWGFTSCECIDVDDTQCFVAMTFEIAMVSFRGTESRGDWLRNLNVPGRTRDYGVVHRGFLGAFQAVESRLRTALSNIGERKLILTGHSLGGALATVMAAEWQKVMPAAWIATFGQPAVGSGAFRMFFLRNYSARFFRFVNDDDIVPRVPPSYEHVGRLLHFDTRGNLQNGPSLPFAEQGLVESTQDESAELGPKMLTEAEYQSLQAQLGSQAAPLDRPLVESHALLREEGLFPRVSDHGIDRYIAKIAAKAGT